MTHKPTLAAAAAALFLITGCNADKADNGAAATTITAKPVAAPNNGDWSEIVATTAEGGFLMGNPNAAVRLVEYGSMTCPHCREFDETGMKPLIDDYVKKGLVGFEFRNYVREGLDMTVSLVARCGGTASFFGLTRALYAAQPDWGSKLQTADQAMLAQLDTLPPAQQFKTLADLTGMPAFAALRGVPREKTAICLADQKAAEQLVQIKAEADSQYQIPGTPSFLLNGKLVEITTGSTVWSQLDKALKDALGG